MVAIVREIEPAKSDIRDEKTWEELYRSLRPGVQKLVHTRPLDTWYGQEDDLVEDIVQETMFRLLNRVLKAERNEMAPVNSLKHMMFRIASNYCKDLRRRDHRLLPFAEVTYSLHTLLDSAVNPADIATEKAYCSRLFELIANEIVDFPEKQRKALLTDIAKHMTFEQPITELEEAFVRAGIEIRLYQQGEAKDSQERNRQYALLSLGYKRLFQSKAIRLYILQELNERSRKLTATSRANLWH